MKNCKIVISLTMLSLLIFQRCTTIDKNPKVILQELTYDSINKKSKLFDVNLTTTIAYKVSETVSQDFNGLVLTIDKNKFLLTPDINSKKINKETNTLLIKFNSNIKFVSKTFKNDSISDKILKSKIINCKGLTIEKDSTFELKSLVVGYSVIDKGLKYE